MQQQNFSELVNPGGRRADRSRPYSTRPTRHRGQHANAAKHPVALGWSWSVQYAAGATAALGFMVSTMLGRTS